MVLAMLLALVCPTALSAQDNEQTAWGYGFQVGVGGMLPTGSLGDDFKGCAVFVGGLQGEWHNLRLKADITYGQPSFKNDNPTPCWTCRDAMPSSMAPPVPPCWVARCNWLHRVARGQGVGHAVRWRVL